MAIFTLLVIGLFCLLFKTTRLAGLAALTLLFLVFPFAFIALLIFGCVALYFNFKLKRIKYYAQPKLPD